MEKLGLLFLILCSSSLGLKLQIESPVPLLDTWMHASTGKSGVLLQGGNLVQFSEWEQFQVSRVADFATPPTAVGSCVTNDFFVAAYGAKNATNLYTSPDASLWSKSFAIPGSSLSTKLICSETVAVGCQFNHSPYPLCYITQDGPNWQPLAINLPLNNLQYSHGYFIGTNPSNTAAWFSTDLVQWTSLSLPKPTFYQITITADSFLVLTTNELYSSPITNPQWTFLTEIPFVDVIQCFKPTTCVFTTFDQHPSTLYLTGDLVHWNPIFVTPSRFTSLVVTMTNSIVMTSANVIFYSDDFINWKNNTFVTGDIGWGVTGGKVGLVATQQPSSNLYRTLDAGHTWSPVVLEPSTRNFLGNLHSVDFLPNFQIFFGIAMNDSSIGAISVTGDTWTQVLNTTDILPNSGINQVTSNSTGIFVSVCNSQNCILLFSPNQGQGWEPLPAISYQIFNTKSAGKETLMSVNDGNLYEFTGYAWTQVNTLSCGNGGEMLQFKEKLLVFSIFNRCVNVFSLNDIGGAVRELDFPAPTWGLTVFEGKLYGIASAPNAEMIELLWTEDLEKLETDVLEQFGFVFPQMIKSSEEFMLITGSNGGAIIVGQ